jgi:signal peptidase I
MKPDGRQAAKSPAREVMEWAVTLAAAVLLALAIHTWVGQIVVVDGPSMEPTLYTDEAVIAGKVEYRFAGPKRGDIVIVRFPGSDRDYIKRVVATGGERISVSGGSVFIGGKRLDEPYIREPLDYDMAETTVPEDAVFVMGDNRNDSSDSHMANVGPIPLGSVVGRAYVIIWPLDRFAKLTEYTGKLEE